MIFPLWKFWTYTPWGWLAAILWNLCELLGVRCPWAHIVFGLIIGRKGRLSPLNNKDEENG
ncbi:hypothetical protein [Sphingopyxis sp. JAI128]|uniref:hypothetical protein n=1 Tax=Sphingopyxis sp. JAI128 TaxID=2723066 RepID=UPI001621604A|nr:hypothetical protein [Sphingopyxis sp. JAI128]MBB6424915.1 hypothetical protein [Sphingopyxis sp. JAI128]